MTEPSRIRFVFLAALSLVTGVMTARAERWQTSVGDRCEGTLSGVYGSIALITGGTAPVRLPLEYLDDAGLGRVEAAVHHRPRL